MDGLYGKVIRVKAGDPLSINVPLTGSPAPTTTWTINDKPLPFSNRILADSGEDYVGLKIPMTQRSDSGKYTITAKNDYGEDSADMTVLVYGMFYTRSLSLFFYFFLCFFIYFELFMISVVIIVCYCD